MNFDCLGGREQRFGLVREREGRGCLLGEGVLTSVPFPYPNKILSLFLLKGGNVVVWRWNHYPHFVDL